MLGTLDGSGDYLSPFVASAETKSFANFSLISAMVTQALQCVGSVCNRD